MNKCDCKGSELTDGDIVAWDNGREWVIPAHKKDPIRFPEMRGPLRDIGWFLIKDNVPYIKKCTKNTKNNEELYEFVKFDGIDIQKTNLIRIGSSDDLVMG